MNTSKIEAGQPEQQPNSEQTADNKQVSPDNGNTNVSGSGFTNHNKMKIEFSFYKSWYAGFRLIDLVPIFSFTKNVQGWSFIRVWSLNWLTYAVSFRLIKRSDLNEDRGVAHVKNVKRYTWS